MNIDLSKMSVQELIKLKKEIDAEQKGRDGHHTKNYVEHELYTKFYSAVIMAFAKNFYGQLDDTDCEHNKAILEAAGDIAWRLRTNALFGLCDAAFGNYKFARESSKMFVRNGTVLGDGIDPEQYRNMYNDLVEVFMKYAGGRSENDHLERPLRDCLKDEFAWLFPEYSRG